MSIERKDDSLVLISISAGISSRHLVLSSKPPIFTLQNLIFSFSRVDLKVFGMARLIFNRSAFLSDGLKKKYIVFLNLALFSF